MTEERQAKIRAKAESIRRHKAQAELAATLSETTGRSVSLDDFLGPEATEQLLTPAVARLKSLQDTHRIWGEAFRGEMAACVRMLARHFKTDEAYLLSHREAGAVRVSVGAALLHAADNFQPGDYDLLLVSDNGASGMNLGYDHLPYSNEYGLSSWGRFVIDLSSVPPEAET